MVQLDPIEIKASNSDYRESAEIIWDILHTDVYISFNLQEKEAYGKASILAKPYFYPTNEIVLDAKSMDIKSVSVNGSSVKYDYKNDSLTIPLSRRFASNDSVVFEVKYIAKPYSAPSRGSKAITEDRGLYFINTDKSIKGKPVQIWTQGETESNSHWVPTIDKPNQRFTTSITMTIPDSFVTLSNGKLVSQRDSGNYRIDRWEMNQPIQPYVMMMAIGIYEIVQDMPWREVPLEYYVESEYVRSAKEMFRNTREMIEYFSNITHTPYPWNKYSQVVVRDYVSGAMENTTASVFGEFKNGTLRELKDDANEDVVAHELFHQWFGDYVTAESWSNITLNESFATFGEQLWRRHKYGTVSEQIAAYQDLNSYLAQAQKSSPPLARYHYNEKEDVFDRISYQKGATILRYMEGLMGSTAFNLSMKEYLSTNANGTAEIEDWRQAVEKVTGQDWHPFFNQWYHRGGHPVLKFKYRFDDAAKTVTINVEQEQDKLYHLPLLVDIVSGDVKSTHTIDIDKRTQGFTFPYPSTWRPIILPDGLNWLPGKIDENKSANEWYQHFKATDDNDYISKARALTETFKKLNNDDIQRLYSSGIKDPIPEIREMAMINMIASENKSLKQTFIDKVLNTATNDTSDKVRAAAFSLLGYWESKEGEDKYYTAIYDSSYMVAAAALYALYQVDKDTAYYLAKNKLYGEAGGDMLPEVWAVIADQGLPADTSLLVDVPYLIYSKRKIDYVSALAIYIQKTSDDNAFNIALERAKQLTESENIKSYRSAMAAQVAGAAVFYKGEVNASNRRAVVVNAHSRLAKLKQTLTYLRDKETDESTLNEYNRLMNALF